MTLRLTLALLLFAPLAACASGPRLVASWYVTYCSAENARAAGEPAGRCKPDLAGERIDDIHILIVNTGAAGALSSVSLVPGRLDPRTADGGEGDALLTTGPRPKQMLKGEFIVLRMGAFPVEETNLRRCLIPVELLVRWNASRRNHPIKVRGTLPTALPSEWIEQCSERAVKAEAAAG